MIAFTSFRVTDTLAPRLGAGGWQKAGRFLGVFSALLLGLLSGLSAANLTRGTETAQRFGVHEITLTGNGGVTNPYDTVATVTFTAPGGGGKTVNMFYDGGNTWRARTYVSSTGAWQWTSSSTDSGLNAQSGSFTASASGLRGKLKKHSANNKQWMTDDGETFINISDTAYYLFQGTNLAGGAITETTFQQFVNQDAAYNVNCLRANVARLRDPNWNSYFTDSNHNKMNLTTFQRTDTRMEWMLNNQPGIYVQLVLVPEAPTWGVDETFWYNLSQANRTRVMRYLVARYAAWPQVFWIVQNDYFLGSSFPHNTALATEWGTYLDANDPWDNLVSTGRNRNQPAFFPSAAWNSYIHLETAGAFSADQIATYASYPQHVYNGEDEYENEGANNGRYFFRWLFWSWLLSGGSANYGSADWDDIKPYDSTSYVGLDSVRYILPYFNSRDLDPAEWTPDDARAWDIDGAIGARKVQVMRKGTTELLAYHPNSASTGSGGLSPTLKTSAARIRVDLSGYSGTLAVEWFRALDNVTQAAGTVTGGSTLDFTAPWTGQDAVLYLKPATGTPAPEINVEGNGVSIPDGDTTPSSTDGTEFGAVDVASGSVTRVFTVQNTGSATLTLGSVSLSGTHAADFSVTAQPASSVAAAGSTTFSVSFDPSAAGLRAASLSLGNNDANENPYNFAIQGSGTDSGGGGGNNLALEGVISAYSAQQTGNEAVKAIDGIDGDDNNRWSASGYPNWIEVDLGADMTFSSTEVHAYANRAYKFLVEAKPDGGVYSVIVDETSNTDPTPITNLFPSVTARYVKLTVTGAHDYTGGWAAIREFKIFSDAPGFPEGLEADTYVWDGAAGANYGTATTMQVKNADSGYDRVSFLRFALSGEGSVAAATLKLKVTAIGGEGSGARTVEIRQLADDSWDETAVTWNNQPSSAGALIASINAGTVGQVYSVDVTSYISQEDAGDGKASFALVQPGGVSKMVIFGTRENAGNEPALEVVRTTQVASPEADTYVWDGASGTNYGAATTMLVKNGSTGYDRIAFLRFSLASMGGGTANSATLKLKVTGIGGEGAGARTVEIRQLSDDSWSETGVTWNNQPSSTGTLITSIDAGTVGQVYEIDVTSYVNQESAGDGKVSFAVVQPGGVNKIVNFGTRENSGNEPELDIE